MRRIITTAVFLASAFLLTGASRAKAADAPQISNDQLKELVASAKTPEDHRKLAAYYRAEADSLEAEAKEHEDLAGAYRKRTDPVAEKHAMSGKTAGHCDYFAKSVREAAKADRQLAAEHELMAKGANK
jgi:hypothetical protein